MKSPLWIVNSILAILLLAMIAFIVYSFKSIFEKPTVVPLKVSAKATAIKKEEGKPKDMRIIYEENDLFGTYKPAIIPVKIAEQLPVLPRPPIPQPVRPRAKSIVQFLEPLAVKITGIIASNNEAKSQVTLVNNATKKSESYRVGDKLFDAYVIRILPRKIIIIRSNGQQETLFLYPADAQEESTILKDTSWSDVVQKQSDFTYLINPTTFAQRVTSLAQLIEMTDLTTAFKGGKTLGVRVGKMENTSIGFALGFMPGDIITKIENLSPTSTLNRMKIYNIISALDMGSEINVQFIRRGQPFKHNYMLFNLAEPTMSLDFLPTPQKAIAPQEPTALPIPIEPMPTESPAPTAAPAIQAPTPPVPAEPLPSELPAPTDAPATQITTMPIPAEPMPSELPAPTAALGTQAPTAPTPTDAPATQITTAPILAAPMPIESPIPTTAPAIQVTTTPMPTESPASIPAPTAQVTTETPIIGPSTTITASEPQVTTRPIPTEAMLTEIPATITATVPKVTAQSTPAKLQAPPVEAPPPVAITPNGQPAQPPSGNYRTPIQNMQKKDTEAMKQFGSKAAVQAQPKTAP